MDKIKQFFNMKLNSNLASRMAFVMLGIILIFSGVGKIIVPPEMERVWASLFLGGGIIQMLIRVLPYVEIVMGVLLIARFKIRWVSWFVMALILNFIVNNTWLIAIGEGFTTCGECLGWGIDVWPIGSLYIDLIMLSLLLIGSKLYQLTIRGVNIGTADGY